MNKKEFSILVGIIVFIIIAISLYFFNIQKEEDSKIISFQGHSKYQVYSVDLPKNIDFSGEPVPLEKPGILERLDQELVKNMYHHSSTILIIKRANRYFPIISRILKQHGIPPDFKYLAVAESNLNNVTSPVGAVGFWQIMKKTGKEYGLEINEEVDERLDLEKSTHAAARYLKTMHKQLGNWTNVAASYNRGINGFIRAQKKQKVTNFYDLRMNNETARYIFRIIALKEIMGKPKKYGFEVYTKHKYISEKTSQVKIDTSISNLVDFAHSFGITYKTLRIHNKWINSTYLPNKIGKTYTFNIPLEKDLEKKRKGIETPTPTTKEEKIEVDSVITSN